MSEPDTVPQTSGAAGGGALSLYALAAAVARRGRMVATLAVAFGVLGFAWPFLFGFTYSATSVLAPANSQSRQASMAGLAAQFGVMINSPSAGQSPQLYEALLTSRAILRDALLSNYRVEDDGVAVETTLLEVLDPDAEDPEERVAQGTRMLRNMVSASTDISTGLVTLTTRANDPELAEAYNRRLLELLNDFNLEKLQSRARAEREFAEERLTAARSELTTAEERLKRFLQENLTYRSSPTLTFEANRMEREISGKLGVYNALMQAVEQARLEEVRNTPVVTVADPPENSAEIASNGPITGAVLGAIIGVLLGVMIVSVGALLDWHRSTYPDDFARWRQARRRLLPFARA